MSPTVRNSSVDLIRAAALVGICVVNLPFHALPLDVLISGPSDPVDRRVAQAMSLLFEGKFFLLFSFLFGWGLEVQMTSAARAGASFRARYMRRLAGLMVLGVLHAILVFSGDILVIYALLGLCLWPLRNAEPARLLRVARWMPALAIVGLLAIGFTLADPLALPAGSLGGSFAEATQARVQDWPATLAFLLLFQGPLAFGAFLCGLAAAKTGFFQPGSTGRLALARALPWLVLTAIPLNLWFALAPQDESLMALGGLLVFAVAAPALSAVYLHVLLVLGDRWRMPDLLVLAGQNSLTAYVLQGVIAGLIFGGYGLGLFGQLDRAQLLPLAVIVALVAMALTGAMARLWGRAPLEMLLRRITYGPA
jgi:uncharacterized protein